MTRVVITGMGAISPVGNELEKIWTNVIEGKTGIKPLTKVDGSEIDVHVGGEIQDFNPKDYGIERRKAKKMDIFAQYAVAAGNQAIEMAGYEITEENAQSVGTIIGSGIGGFETIEAGANQLKDKGPRRLDPMFIIKAIGNMAAANMAMETGAKGTSLDVVTACASGTDSIGIAYEKIKSGQLEAAFAGGADAAMTNLALASFSAIGAVSNNEDPTKASRPFDKDRDGFVFAEGAAILFLESLESAQARGANILAEVVGYGSNSDANHLTAPYEDGRGAAATMKEAMKQAGIGPEDVDYINAHGTSTPTNDVAETRAIKLALGDAAYQTHVSSTKGHTGHMFAAAGAIEALFSVLAIMKDTVPPTIGLENEAEDCDLNYAKGQPVEKEITYVLSNSLGFGGHNATLALKKWTDA